MDNFPLQPHNLCVRFPTIGDGAGSNREGGKARDILFVQQGRLLPLLVSSCGWEAQTRAHDSAALWRKSAGGFVSVCVSEQAMLRAPWKLQASKRVEAGACGQGQGDWVLTLALLRPHSVMLAPGSFLHLSFPSCLMTKMHKITSKLFSNCNCL